MRAFVAINLDSREKERLAHALTGLREAGFPIRWARADGVHLTLKFLGEVAEDSEPEICAALEKAAADSAPFVMSVGGLGAFPSLSHPRVVWVGVLRSDDLDALYSRAEDELASRGFEREERSFRPHITVGRARRDASRGDFKTFDEAVVRFDYKATIEVNSVDLMRSRLRPTGAEYTVLRSAGLRGG